MSEEKKKPSVEETLLHEREMREEQERDTRENDQESFSEARAEAEQAADDKAEKLGREGQPLMPKPTFSTFVLSLASSALVQLGEVPDPASGKTAEDLSLAKHTIDILSMLQEKIQNGLTSEEARLMEGLLYELRMKYVMKK